MNDPLMKTRGLFVTGTNTDVGKTYVSTMILRELRSERVNVGAYKPVASGSETDAAGNSVWSDIEELGSAIDKRYEASRICPQRFSAPLAPPVAARLENTTVNASLLREGARWWEGKVDFLVTEGVGGLLCPLTETETIADLARDLGYPLIIVASLELGTINHTLLTIEVAKTRGLEVAGIIMNQSKPDQTGPNAGSNPTEIAARCGCPVLGTVGYDQHKRKPTGIDWLSIAGEGVA